MPYRSGTVPATYEPAYLQRELRRIGEAYDFQDAIGGLALSSVVTPAGIPQSLTPVPVLMNCWINRTPNENVGDGPVQTDPRVSPVGEIEVYQDGQYMVNMYANFAHLQGAEVVFELFINDIGTGLGAVVDASQQSQASSTSFTGILALAENNVLDVRVFSIGDEDITWANAAFQVIKLRDLRTRFA